MSEVAARPSDPLATALVDSRQRWRDLVAISADIAFETDREGRFVFLSPSEIIGWPVLDLLGQPSAVLLPQEDDASFDPFRAERPMRNCRVWLKRSDGTLSWMSFSVAPLHDSEGVLAGARGVARDVTEYDRAEIAMARTLRRCELLDHMVWHMRTELMAPRKMTKALQALVDALGGHGAMVLEPACAPAAAAETLLYGVGGDVPGLRDLALRHLAMGHDGPMLLRGPEGHPAMLCATPTRFDTRPGVVLWRRPGDRLWNGDELSLLASAVGTLRGVLEQGAVQREMARQSRFDGLTGLYNRRAFEMELGRWLDRLERADVPGSLLHVDVDRLALLNDARGHEAGDQVLRTIAGMLRGATRPGDLIGRLGGDDFGVWLDGMDELAAAERSDRLCVTARAALARLFGGGAPGVSIGVVGRWPGSSADGPRLLRRAEQALRNAKAAGGGWRVWHGEDDDDV